MNRLRHLSLNRWQSLELATGLAFVIGLVGLIFFA